MAQIKIYGLKSNLDENKLAISASIHDAVMSALEYPPEKKFHRFISLEPSEFIYPSDRSEKYIIVEISMFEGRSIEAKKNLIKGIYSNINKQTDITSQDIEITIFETPKANWGIRGLPGDELALGYKVEV
ncbi:MAG: tautomerase family protein [Gammaproteobacteria bacterium]|nr:tautomerase family protein [Gammaproteobacteria bacterium]